MRENENNHDDKAFLFSVKEIKFCENTVQNVSQVAFKRVISSVFNIR